MTHYTVQFNSVILQVATVSSLKQERFQATLKDWRGTHQLEFCWQPVSCSKVGGEAARENALIGVKTSRIFEHSTATLDFRKKVINNNDKKMCRPTGVKLAKAGRNRSIKGSIDFLQF